MTKFRWGGIDKAKPGSLYLDETIRRMVTTIRSSLIDLATDLTSEGAAANEAIKHGQTTFMGQNAKAYRDDRFAKAEKVLNLMEQKLPAKSSPYAVTLGLRIAQTYQYLAENSGSKTAKAKALKKYVEPLITKSKEDSTNSRRVVFSYLQNKEALKELFGVVAAKVGDRPGGYTRIIKLGVRQGDAAPICFIELVDFDENMAKTDGAKKKSTRRSRKSSKATEAPAAEVAAEAPAAEAPAAEEAKAE